jgi:hypothetical protein
VRRKAMKIVMALLLALGGATLAACGYGNGGDNEQQDGGGAVEAATRPPDDGLESPSGGPEDTHWDPDSDGP